MTNINERHLALKILEEVDKKHIFVSQVIDDYFQHEDLTKQQRSFISKLVYGVIENQILINYYIHASSSVKNNKIKPVIRIILQLGIYQLLFLDKVPAHAAINEAVKLVKKRKMFQLRGFVNGVLRNIERNHEDIYAKIQALPFEQRLSITYSVKEELIKYLLEMYEAGELEAYLKSSLAVKDTCIRTNILKQSPTALKERLSKKYTVRDGYLFDEAFYLSDYNRLEDVEGFREGCFQVQDESSMCVARLVNQKAKSIIDVCSAPGGKVTHLAELKEDQASIIACDVSQKKVQKIDDNCKRLALHSITTQVADASQYNEAWKDAFDCVLADVPCSGLGILRTKPDIKMNMSLEKIESLIKIQKEILDNVHQYVKIGGELIYSTCTINSNENEKQMHWFLDRYPNFEKVDLSKERLDESIQPFVKDGYIRLLTHTSKTDGFFIAKLRRIK